MRKIFIDITFESEKRILEGIQKLHPVKTNEVNFVVYRTVNLRVKPSTKSPVICYLFPEQIVSKVSKRGKWVYVKYFDYIEEVPKTGWVFKKYLKRVKK